MSNIIGPRLGGWRKARGLTQARLAALAGISQAAVSGIELGRRDVSLRTVCRLALALKITPGTLIDQDPAWPILDRHAVDAIARAVVSGARNLPPDQRRLADALAGAARPTLEASGAPGAVRARRRGERAYFSAERQFGRNTIDLVLARLDKHLAGIQR